MLMINFEEGRVGQFESHYCFSKNACSRHELKQCFFANFSIIISYILSENIFEIPQFVPWIWGLSPLLLTIFINLMHLWHFLVTKKMTRSACNRWWQNSFTFNLLCISCLISTENTILKKPNTIKVQRKMPFSQWKIVTKLLLNYNFGHIHKLMISQQ